MRPPRGGRILPGCQRARGRGGKKRAGEAGWAGPGGGGAVRARGEAGRMWPWAEPEAAAREGNKMDFDFCFFEFKCIFNFKPNFEQEESVLWVWPKNKSCSKLNSLQL
jgi:hypothetical protein